jgi:hypothetical protein
MLKDPRQMITDTTFKTLTLAIATYIVFFAYSVSRNPVLECFLTILLMINLSILTYATSQNDFMEAHFRQEVYDDEPMNGCDDEDEDEDEDDQHDQHDDQHECECETPRTNAEQEATTLSPQAATPPWPVMLSPEELAKVNLDLTVNNEPPPFSVRALVRALDSKSPTNLSDLSGGVAPLPPCSHNTDISGATI